MEKKKEPTDKTNKGSYLLLMKLARNKEIEIGKKSGVSFPGGYYCYVGSAMNNLEKRVCRHMSDDKKRRWHIDWFLDEAKLLEVKKIESNERLECELSEAVSEISNKVPMKGFGSSDCKHCLAHMYYFEEDPNDRIEKVIKRWRTSKRTTRR